MHLSHRTMLQILAAAFALAASAGCGGNPAESLCNSLCDCFDECPSEAVDQCVEPIEKAREQADAVGCGSEYDAYLSCVEGELTCTTAAPDIEGLCPDERQEVQSCAANQ